MNFIRVRNYIYKIFLALIIIWIGASNKRPLLSNDCASLPEAEKHRREIMRDMSKKISSIHNASLGEHRIRELNDEINKLQRQRHYWEIRISELGGADFKSSRGKQYIDTEGECIPGTTGYRYYGAAKDLPGIRELFAEETNEDKANKRCVPDYVVIIIVLNDM